MRGYVHRPHSYRLRFHRNRHVVHIALTLWSISIRRICRPNVLPQSVACHHDTVDGGRAGSYHILLITTPAWPLVQWCSLQPSAIAAAASRSKQGKSWFRPQKMRQLRAETCYAFLRTVFLTCCSIPVPVARLAEVISLRISPPINIASYELDNCASVDYPR